MWHGYEVELQTDEASGAVSLKGSQAFRTIMTGIRRDGTASLES